MRPTINGIEGERPETELSLAYRLPSHHCYDLQMRTAATALPTSTKICKVNASRIVPGLRNNVNGGSSGTAKVRSSMPGAGSGNARPVTARIDLIDTEGAQLR